MRILGDATPSRDESGAAAASFKPKLSHFRRCRAGAGSEARAFVVIAHY